MPITSGTYQYTSNDTKIQYATQARYDTEKQNAIAQGYTVVSEDLPNLPMTLSISKTVTFSDGSLP